MTTGGRHGKENNGEEAVGGKWNVRRWDGRGPGGPPHALLVPPDLLRNDLQRDIARDARCLGGMIVCGHVGVEEETDVAEEAVRGSVDGRRHGACLGSAVLAVRAMSRAAIDDDGTG